MALVPRPDWSPQGSTPFFFGRSSPTFPHGKPYTPGVNDKWIILLANRGPRGEPIATELLWADLLRAATKDQLFTFNGQLYEQTDGVAMGSPLGPLLANAFMCSIEETLEREGNMPKYYKRFVDDTLTIMPNTTSADNFLDILNQCHSSIKFTMETESNSMLPFLGTQLLNKHTRVETKVYVKPTNTGPLLHYKSHVDDRYKRGLLKTMLDRAYRLLSNWHYFSEECDRLKLLFSRLKYPDNLVNSTISRFVTTRASDQPVSSPAVSDRLDPI